VKFSHSYVLTSQPKTCERTHQRGCARDQRFFAWAFVLATSLALGLFWAELAVRPAPVPAVSPAAAAAGTMNPNDLDLRALQLLVVAAAVVATLVSFAGLVIATRWRGSKREENQMGSKGYGRLTRKQAEIRRSHPLGEATAVKRPGKSHATP